MSYYSQAFIDECSKSYGGEAMQARVHIRLLDGHNMLLHSNDLLDSAWTISSDLSVDTELTPPSLPRFGSAHQALQTSSGSSLAGISQTITGFDYGWYVFSAVVSQLGIDANQGDVTLLVEEATTGPTTWQFAKFKFAGGVCTHQGTDQDALASGVNDLGNGMYQIWMACRSDGGGGTVGNPYKFSLYPNYGSATSGRGVNIQNMHVEVERDSDAAAMTGALCPVLTGSERIEGGGAPGTLVTATEDEGVIGLNPIGVKREYSFGVVESQQWQVELTHFNLALMATELSGCWICVEGGFPEANEWALLAQGKVAVAEATTDMNVVLDVDDPMRVMLDAELLRDSSYDSDVAWASEIKSEATADGSSAYDMEEPGAGVTIVSHTWTPWDTWKIVFTNTADFKIVQQSTGVEHTGYSTAADATVVLGVSAFTVQSEGWTGTYAGGDTFVFYTSARMTSTNVTALGLIIELLTGENHLDLGVFDVKAGLYYDSPLYDQANMWDASVSDYNLTVVKGVWEAGSRYATMIQEILYVIHGSIYTMPTGQLALWEAKPNEIEAVSLNGDFDAGPVDILQASLTDDNEEVYNVVRYDYLHLSSGSEAQLTARDKEAKVITDRVKAFNIHWRVTGSAVDSAASKSVLRYRRNRRKATARTTLIGASFDMTQPVYITEPALGLSVKALIVERKVDVLANEAQVSLALDDFTLDSYMKVTDEFGNVPGEGVDDGNKVAPTGGPYTGLNKVF